MRKALTLLLLILVPMVLWGQDSQLLKTADDLFASGKYSAATEKYQECVRSLSGQEKRIAEMGLRRSQACATALANAQSAMSSRNYDTAISEYQVIVDSNPADSNAKSQLEKAKKLRQDAMTTLSVSKTSLSFSYSGGSQSVNVTSNSDWVIGDKSAALTVTKSGSTVSVMCPANSSTSAVDMYFYIKTSNGVKQQRVTVKQEGKPEARLTVTPTNISVSSGSGTYTVYVTSSTGTYTISLPPSWCSVKNKYDSYFVLSYQNNPNGESRTGYFYVKSGSASQRIDITQDAGAATLGVAPTTLSLSASDGTSRTIYVSTNTTYTVTDLPYWCTVVNKTASSFAISYTRNTYSTARTGAFYVRAGNRSQRIDVTQKAASSSSSSSYGSGSSSSSSSSRSGSYGGYTSPRRDPFVRFGLGLSMDILIRDNPSSSYYDDYYDPYYYGGYNNYYGSSSNTTTAFGFGVGVRMRIGRTDNWFNLITGGRYVFGKQFSGWMIPALLNWNIINSDSFDFYLGGGYEFGLGSGYSGAGIVQMGFATPHTDFSFYYRFKETLGVGFTWYF